MTQPDDHSGDAPTEVLVAAWEAVRNRTTSMDILQGAADDLIARLTADNAALAEQVASLTRERDEARGKYDALVIVNENTVARLRRQREALRGANEGTERVKQVARGVKRASAEMVRAAAVERDTAEATVASLRAAAVTVRDQLRIAATAFATEGRGSVFSQWADDLDAALPAEPT